MADDVSNGELYRLMLSHGDVLKEIKSDVKAQNGRVYKLETDVQLLTTATGTMPAIEGRLKRLENDSIRIKTLWSAGVFLGVMGWEWVKHKLGF